MRRTLAATLIGLASNLRPIPYQCQCSKTCHFFWPSICSSRANPPPGAKNSLPLYVTAPCGENWVSSTTSKSPSIAVCFAVASRVCDVSSRASAPLITPQSSRIGLISKAVLVTSDTLTRPSDLCLNGTPGPLRRNLNSVNNRCKNHDAKQED